jgi:dienelactone hydrolase
MHIVWLAAIGLLAIQAPAFGQTPAGSVKGTAFAHDTTSRQRLLANANVALPASVTGDAVFFGKSTDAPATAGRRAPVVVFLHGSSGLGLKAIEDWQRWLAGLGIASMAPDSFALPNRVTYESPIDRDTYERVHALRAAEIAAVSDAVTSVPWADATRMVLAGTSEGAVAVARHGGAEYRGRIVYSWSCEDNYFVKAHATSAVPGQPVLNVMSTTDPYFSPSNAWLGNAAAKGHCATALAPVKDVTVVLIAGAPHTLINLPAARDATEGFLRRVLKQ